MLEKRKSLISLKDLRTGEENELVFTLKEGRYILFN